jgi:acyl-CoA thioester hydrolase
MIQPAKIQIRYSDIDFMGHVNNAVYLNYFEYTRVYYFNILLGEDWDWEHNGFILVKNEIEYLMPLLLNDKPVIEMYIGEVGNKSFMLHYELKLNNQLYTIASSKMVSYNSAEKKSIGIPKQMKAHFSSLKKHISHV